MTLRYLSVCSGVEAATLAWHPLGWEPVAFSEIEPFPCAVLEQRFPDVKNLGSMLEIKGRKYRGKVDLLVGGTPCQAFSVAGKRQSLDDDRGNLTLKFAELADDIDPDIILWENVPGVLNTKDNAFGCFLGKLAGESVPLEPAGAKWTDAGYVLGPQRAIAWRVLDAQYFGLAQRRRRVFVVACPAGGVVCPREVLLEREGMRRDHPPSRETGESVAGAFAARTGSSGGRAGADENDAAAGYLQPVKWPADVAPTLNAHFGDKLGLENQHALNGAGLFVPATAHTLTGEGFDAGEDGSGRGTPLVPVMGFHGSQDPCVSGDISHPVGRNQGQETCIAVIQERAVCENPKAGPDGCGFRSGEVAYTLEARPVPQAIASQYAVRRLTPVECERLQGMPDNHTQIEWRGKPADMCPDGPRYKSIGNSMAVNVMHWIGRRIDRLYRAAERDMLREMMQ